MTVELNQYYKHRDGGLYLALHVGVSTVDKSEHVVYKHVYPFESKIWIRPLSEWTPERFEKITQGQFEDLLSACPREQLMAEITAKRKDRKG